MYDGLSQVYFIKPEEKSISMQRVKIENILLYQTERKMIYQQSSKTRDLSAEVFYLDRYTACSLISLNCMSFKLSVMLVFVSNSVYLLCVLEYVFFEMTYKSFLNNPYKPSVLFI